LEDAKKNAVGPVDRSLTLISPCRGMLTELDGFAFCKFAVDDSRTPSRWWVKKVVLDNNTISKA
jgi:hypothetical protein